MKRMKLIPVLVLILAAGAGAGTLTQTYTPFTIPAVVGVGTTQTNWSGSIVLPQFNASLGTLNSVQITLDGTVTGEIDVENIDVGPSSVSTILQALISLTMPDASLVQVDPSVGFTDNLPGCTGVCNWFDYTGENSIVHANLSQSASQNSALLTSGSDLLFFTGNGTVSLGVTGTGLSGDQGGNVADSFSTYAAATGSITYSYTANETPATPEPASLLLLGSALAGLAFWRKRQA